MAKLSHHGAKSLTQKGLCGIMHGENWHYFLDFAKQIKETNNA